MLTERGLAANNPESSSVQTGTPADSGCQCGQELTVPERALHYLSKRIAVGWGGGSVGRIAC